MVGVVNIPIAQMSSQRHRRVSIRVHSLVQLTVPSTNRHLLVHPV